MSDKSNIIIAVDGLSASGKGTLASGIAKFFDFDYLDTGLLYRCVAYIFIRSIGGATPKDISISDVPRLLEIANNITLDTQELYDDNLALEDVGQVASMIAKISGLRVALNKLQKEFPNGSKKAGVVLDGRDIGTVIFPNAQCKLFVTASIDVRARRRFNQLIISRKNISYENMLLELKERDTRDLTRDSAPLQVPESAFIIDTTNLTIQESLNLSIDYIKQKL